MMLYSVNFTFVYASLFCVISFFFVNFRELSISSWILALTMELQLKGLEE